MHDTAFVELNAQNPSFYFFQFHFKTMSGDELEKLRKDGIVIHSSRFCCCNYGVWRFHNLEPSLNYF